MGRPAEVASAVSRQTLALSAAAGAACSVSVGLLERGATNFTAPLRAYLGDVTLIGSALSFLRSFVADARIYAPAVRRHPPGFLLSLWALHWIGLRGGGWAALLVIVGGALIAPALLVIIRRSTPVLVGAVVVVPAFLWPAPEPVALFVGVALLSIALLLRGHAVSAGIAFGGALFLAYEAVIAAVLAVALRPRRGTIAVAIAVASLIVVRFAGFSWLAGARHRF